MPGNFSKTIDNLKHCNVGNEPKSLHAPYYFVNYTHGYATVTLFARRAIVLQCKRKNFSFNHCLLGSLRYSTATTCGETLYKKVFKSRLANKVFTSPTQSTRLPRLIFCRL